MKEKLENMQLVAQILSLLAVPILVAFFGWKIQEGLKEKEVQKDFVQIAVSILSAKKVEGGEDAVIRGWAVRLLQKASPVALSDEEMQALENASVTRTLLVPCRTPEVKKPEWATLSLKDSDTPETKVRALLAERRQRIGYEKMLEAAVSVCR